MSHLKKRFFNHSEGGWEGQNKSVPYICDILVMFGQYLVHIYQSEIILLLFEQGSEERGGAKISKLSKFQKKFQFWYKGGDGSQI